MEQVSSIMDELVDQVASLEPPTLVRIPPPAPVIEIIVDRSGSMQGTIDQLMRSLAEVVQDQHKRFPNALVNLTLFSDRVEHLPERALSDVMASGFAPIRTGGCTALFKAIHTTMLRAYERFKDGRFLLFIIVTDGEDNASGEINANAAKKMVQYSEYHNGSVMFLGANRSILEQGVAAGIKCNLEFNPAAPCEITREASNHVSSEMVRGESSNSAPIDEEFLRSQRDPDDYAEDHLPEFLRSALEGTPKPPALTRSFTLSK